jgi:hypothetical protein
VRPHARIDPADSDACITPDLTRSCVTPDLTRSRRFLSWEQYTKTYGSAGPPPSPPRR